MSAAGYVCVAWRAAAARVGDNLLAITKKCFEVSGYVERQQREVGGYRWGLATHCVPCTAPLFGRKRQRMCQNPSLGRHRRVMTLTKPVSVVWPSGSPSDLSELNANEGVCHGVADRNEALRSCGLAAPRRLLRGEHSANGTMMVAWISPHQTSQLARLRR